MYMCVLLSCAPGASWCELCQGSADAVLVPLLLGAACASGADAELASLTAAQQALAADREAVVLDDLAKVCRGRDIW
jgi:hypothetical protein